MGIPARRLAAFLLVLVLAWGARAEPMGGVDYLVMDPPAQSAPGRIEVIEFFHYGCSACYRLEPLLEAWLADLPPDVEFRRVPALRRQAWIPLTRLFFALEATGQLDRLHAEVYREVHEAGVNLGDSSQALPWAARQGIDRERFAAALESDDTSAKVQRARDMTVAYGVNSTPTLIVDGRYLTNAAMLGRIDALLPVVDELIDKARQERKAR